MKLELAVLPLEVWADIFISPYQWINRQELAQFANNIKNHQFTEKLQKLLHGCGKQNLHYLQISSKPKDIHEQPKSEVQLRKRKTSECKASLAIAPRGSLGIWQIYKDCEFPQSEMPENIQKFKQLSINYLDDEVLAFLDKIKPLFTNVNLTLLVVDMESARDMRIFFKHFQPMLGTIRKMACDNNCLGILEEHFPGTLALAKELKLYYSEPASIPALLNWLDAPQDFAMLGPRLLEITIESETILAIVNAVRQHFLAATIPTTFAVYLQFYFSAKMKRADEFNLENTATNEELTARNAIFTPNYGDAIHFVEILRHPVGADSKMREWLKKRAYFEKQFGVHDEDGEDANKVIWITQPTIGFITKRKLKMKRPVKKKRDHQIQRRK